MSICYVRLNVLKIQRKGYAMVQATRKSSGNGMKKIITFKEMSYFSKNEILSPTFDIVPRFVLYINFVVVLTLFMTHFMNYICIKHIRRG